MKSAVISLGSRSSLSIAEAMKNYFGTVDEIDIRGIQVTLSSGKSVPLNNGLALENYDCIYARGSFRYSQLLRSLSASIPITTYMPIKSETFTIGHDKLLTHLALQHLNIPMPSTYITSSTKAAKKILNEVNYPIVLKFPHGTQGRGVMFAESYAAASSMLDALFALKQPFIIQEYIDTGGVDVRALVAGDKVIASMKRHAVRGEMRANIHAGGVGEVYNLDGISKRIAVNTAHSIGAEICAVDILESPKGPLVIEANLSPGIRGITNATGINVADKIASYLFDRTSEISSKDVDKKAVKAVGDIENGEHPQHIIANLDFRGERILLPKIISDLSQLSEKDETVIIAEKGKILVERV